MKHLITDFTRKLSRLFALVALLCVGATAASAEDLGELELGKTYDLPAYKEVTATLTAPKDGTVLMEGEALGIYTDAAHTSAVKTEWHGYALGGQSNSFEVTAGTVYYLHIQFSMGGKVRFSMEQTAEIVSVEPQNGSVFSHTGTADCIVTFNVPVTVEGGTISTGNTNAKVNPSTFGSTIQVHIATRINSWLSSGIITKGDEFTITLTGIKTVTGGDLYNGDGKLALKYICAGDAAKLVSKSIPTTFKSYYMPGDPEAIASLTFDKDLLTESSSVSIFVGNPEGETGEYYLERLPVTIDGKTVSVDFSGKSRRTNDMLSTGIAPDIVSFQFNQIKDSEGNYVASTDAGSLGSFAFSLPYQELAKVDVISDFTPANGSSLQGVDNILLWMRGNSAITFTGFKFEYADDNEMKSVVVPVSQCTFEDLGNDECNYSIPVPAEVKGKKNITVTLADLMSRDGIDHTRDVKAQYDSFVITWSDPADGAEFATLADGTEISIQTNYSDLYPQLYIEYEIIDMNPVNPDQAILKSYSWLTRNEYDEFTSTVYGDYKMIRNHTYNVAFTAWESESLKNEGAEPVGTTSLTWYGLSEPFVASDILFVSIDPAQGTLLEPTQTEFTLTFDGMVNIAPSNAQILLGMGESLAFESLTPTDPTFVEETGLDYSNIWTLKVPADYMETLTSALMFSIKAYDMSSRLVVNPDEEYPDENSFLLFDYETANSKRDFSVMPDNDFTIENLEKIVVSADAGIMPSYNVPVAQITVTSLASGNVVAHVTDVELALGGDISDEVNTMLILKLDTPVNENGSYTILFPEGVFVIGNDMASWNSAEKSITFTVDGDSGIEGITADENGVFVVYNFSGIHVATVATAAELNSLPAGFYIVNGRKMLIK